MVESALVRLLNETHARLALAPARIEELPIELGQLQRAIEAVDAKVAFDVEPVDFRMALLELAVPRHD